MFRCSYCIPGSPPKRQVHQIRRSDLLTFEEIARLVRVSRSLGVRKVRITGGEPLLRARLDLLVRLLSPLGTEIALTTNGFLLERSARSLAEAGLGRVSVSLDALDVAKYRSITGSTATPQQVLAGIAAAHQAGLSPVKINVVVRRGINDDQILPLAAAFRGTGHTVRFIEYMDVGGAESWRREAVVSGHEVIEQVNAVYPLESILPQYPGEVAQRWRYRDRLGEIGVITGVTAPFCSTCTRLRLSADGRLFTCLFAEEGLDVRSPLRQGADDNTLRLILHDLWRRRSDRYSELRHEMAFRDRAQMSYLGG